MKEYNRQTKRWEEPTGQGKFKKRETCRGGREHDYALTIPLWEQAGEITPKAIKEYYESKKRIAEFEQKENEILRANGIRQVRFSWHSHNAKWYVCLTCGKRSMKDN